MTRIHLGSSTIFILLLIILYFLSDTNFRNKMDIESPFDKWRENVIDNIDLIIKLNRQKILYMRPELTFVDKDNENFVQINTVIPSSIKYFAEIEFYPYNSEGVRDYGWGCAWRCIESIIVNHIINEDPIDSAKLLKLTSFEALFYVFGLKENLLLISEEIYKSSPEVLNYLKESDFAPFVLKSGWAEPFIGFNAMKFFGIKGELLSVNSWPTTANAPKSVAPDSVNFDTFIEKLMQHFSSALPLPVMIDDGTWALCIIGIGVEISESSQLITLWIADPHIEEAVASDQCSFYTVTLDKEGIQLSNSVTLEQSEMMYNKESYEGVYFKQKDWMLLMPGS